MFSVGFLLFRPISYFIGRKGQTTKFGVQKLPFARFNHNFYNMHPLYASRKFFLRYSLGSGVFFATAFAYYFYDPHKGRDKHYSLPHVKPFAAMVDKQYLHPADREAMEYHTV